MIRRLLALALLVLVTGCSATLADVMKEKADGAGTLRAYAVPADQAWSIARTVFRWEGFDAIEEHRTEGYMLTTSAQTFFSGGTLAGVWISAAGPERSTVAVVTKRRVQTAIVTVLTEDDFHRRFAEIVEIVKAGKPIPLAPPANRQ